MRCIGEGVSFCKQQSSSWKRVFLRLNKQRTYEKQRGPLPALKTTERKQVGKVSWRKYEGQSIKIRSYKVPKPSYASVGTASNRK